jgi:cellobiose-specific phosphotransferase system component IIC
VPEHPLVARLRAVSEIPELLAIRTALPYSFVGLLVAVAIFMLLAPSGSLLERFQRAFLDGFGPMAALLVLALAREFALRRNLPQLPLVLACALAFALLVPHVEPFDVRALSHALGGSGLFLAMLIALVGIALVRAGVALTRRAALGSWLGASALVACAFAVLATGFSPAAALESILAPLGHMGDSLAALLAITFVETLLWTIGIHGPAVLAAIVLPVYLTLQAQNTEASRAGLPLPHIVTVSTFLFVFPGGAGATLPVAVLLLRSRVARLRTVARAALVPSFFNVNEPLMFGLPLVLNPLLALPFIIVPLVLGTVSYLAIAHGLVARPVNYAPSSWTTPVAVWFATGDWRAIVLASFDVALAFAIYAPFVAAYERAEARRSALEIGPLA